MGPYLTVAEKIFDDGDVVRDSSILNYYKSETYQPDRYFYLLATPHKEDILQYSEEYQYNLSKYFNNTHLLGPYEATILSKMVFTTDKYINIIFGALGSGKSTTLKFIIEYFNKNLKSHYTKNISFPIYIDLNYVGDIRNYGYEQNYFDEIFNRISEKIETALTIKYAPNKDFYHFWQKCVQVAKERENFSWIYTINNLISDMQPENSLRALRKHVDQFKPEKRFRFWSLLLSIESIITKCNLDTFLILDNIDQHASLLQNRLLNYLHIICQESKRIRVFVAMRVITFGNTWGDIKKYLIPHSPIMPVQVLLSRIADFIMRLKRNEIGNLPRMRDYHKATLFVLLLEIYYLLNKQNSKLSRTISAVSGFSIRRALNLTVYLFKQESTPFDRITQILSFIEHDNITSQILEDLAAMESKNFDHMAEKYFFGIRDMRNPGHLQYSKDTFYCNLLYYRSYHEIIEEKLIENCYHNANQNLAMEKIRIISYLSQNKVITINDLFNYINRFTHNVDDFIYAVNSLASQHRRLIFFDGPVSFKDSDMLIPHIDKRIMLTQAGRGYLEFLSDNYEYIQFCMLERGEYFGFTHGVESLNELVKKIFQLIRIDIEQTREFRESCSNKRMFLDSCPKLLSYRLMHDFIERNLLHSLEKLSERQKDSSRDLYTLREIALNLENNLTLLENSMDELFDKIPESLKALRAKFERLKAQFFVSDQFLTEKRSTIPL